jgi:sigma-B regulation protein RsbU (phosphoserine phosphatase)
MKILVADDDPTTLETLTRALERWNLEVVPATNGREAWEILQQPDPPRMALVGLDDARHGRVGGVSVGPGQGNLQTCYLILLTSRNSKDDLMMGLLSGADDYVTKPFHAGELWARIEVGRRVLSIQQSLADRVGTSPKPWLKSKACGACCPFAPIAKKFATGKDYWRQVESYLAEHTDATFTHGICPDCFSRGS